MTGRHDAGDVVAIIGALDTKGIETAYLRDEITRRGCQTCVIDIGVLGTPAFPPSVPRTDVAAAAGASIDTLVARGDRGAAVTAMAEGARRLVGRLFEEGRFAAVIGLGGGAGTAVATAAMRALPLGVPTVMVSTVASGDVKAFLGVKDIVMIPAIVDISGLNRISRGVLARAAGAVCGMLEVDPDGVAPTSDKPLIAASMFGNTTECVDQARRLLETRGFEVLVFHATGTGGLTMEGLIEGGLIAGVLDVTTTEWADELLGGVMSAGPTRLEAAALSGTPAVVAPGCLDMANFWQPESVPARYRGRRIYQHNPNVTLVRTTPEENTELGRRLADRLNRSVGPIAVFVPLKGISVLSAPGGPFHWPEADAALFDALRTGLRADIPVYEIEAAINDAVFAERVATGLLDLMRSGPCAKTSLPASIR